MTALTFTLFDALKSGGIPEEKARAATEAVERSIEQARESIKKELEERYAIHSKDIATKGDVEKVRLDVEKVRLEIEKVRADLKTDIAQIKVDLIKWNVGAIFAAGAFTVALANFFK